MTDTTIVTKDILAERRRKRRLMGKYINIGNDGFRKAREGEYVDKSMLINFINSTLGTEQCMTCVTRARRFGKSMAAKMLSAYYDQSCDSRALFADLKVASEQSFDKHLNRYPVIYLDMTYFLTMCPEGKSVVTYLEDELKQDLCKTYPEVVIRDVEPLMDALLNVCLHIGKKFIMIIDEWDALCREITGETDTMDRYVNLLRALFKTPNTDRIFAGVYMTGILPIKRYKTQSALNNFEEYTMLSPAQLAGCFGFTEAEVQALCEKYHSDPEQMKYWYDGYQMGIEKSIYNPFAVIKAVQRSAFESYWTSTNLFESLRQYITMNFDGLKDAVVRLIAGESVPMNALRFSNDMHVVESKDDVLTVLCHLGYLTYDRDTHCACIPNYEVRQEFEASLQDTCWSEVLRALNNSDNLLKAVLRGEANVVADAVDKVHEENTSVLQYNDENALASVLSLAFYAARGWYTIVRELPAGLGFADIVMIPKRGVDRPAMVLELKWNKTADSAIRQMKEKRYAGVLKDFAKEILLVGINYSKKTKKHECVIENIQGVFSRSKAENSRSKERKSRSEKVRMIKEFCSMAPRSLEDIAAIVGSKDKYYMKRTLLDPLLGKELFMTEPESPNSPKQRYYC